MEIQLNSRRDYELYIKGEVGKMQVSNKHKSNIRKLIMEGFDAGIKLTQGDLKVQVFTL